MKQKDTLLLYFMSGILWNFKLLIAFLILISLVSAITFNFSPYLLKVIIDSIFEAEHNLVPLDLYKKGFLYVLFYILLALSQRLYEYIWLKCRPNMQRIIMTSLMRRMLEHSVSFYQDNSAGSLINKINDVTGGIPDILKVFISDLITNLFTLILAVYILYVANFIFSLLFVLWAFIFVFFSLRYSYKGKNLVRDAAEIRSQVMGGNVDILSNILSVKIFSNEKREIKKIESSFDELVLSIIKRDWYFLKISSFQSCSFAVFQGICIYFLIDGLKTKDITVGDFVLVLTLNISLVRCLESLASSIKNLAEDIGNTKQGLTIIFSPVDVEDKKDAIPLSIKGGAISFESVKFSHRGSPPIFDNLCVYIPEGQKVGLVGFSGSGKTTFVNLLLRFYNIDDGGIMIDGQDIRSVTQNSLRSSIGFISQDPSLFHRTVMENIRYGYPNASDCDVFEAAKKAGAHDFITHLSSSYQSLVGERGIKLSGGQRQRIAIARVFLKNAPILILDEATSQLDSTTEIFIQKNIKKIIESKKTVLIIAHRLSTLSNMDRILVFKEGRIVEDGSHDELLSSSSVYKTMWDNQIGGFLPEKL
jgi:ATP-binding cassette subfamily B protein